MLIFAIVTVVVLVGIDQLIKLWAIYVLQEKETMPFLHIGDFEILDLTYLENSGAVFGSFAGMRWLLVGCTSIMLIACIWGLVRYHERSRVMCISLILILAGGIGNLIDRLFRGGLVVDYFEVKFFDFAIFNFADCCVVVGIFLFIFYLLFIDSKIDKKKKAEAEAARSQKESVSNG
ncbi:MAG: signal peptidase II [Ruminococcus sp.]|nr:signal peptidase II [Ruminococcus sp.]